MSDYQDSEHDSESGPDTYDGMAWSDSDATDDDNDFERSASPPKRLRVAVGPTSAVVDFSGAEGDDTHIGDLRANAGTLQRLCLRFSCPKHKLIDPPASLTNLFDGIATALAQNLEILRIDNFPGCGDPVFGTNLEFKRREQAEASDIFARLAKNCQGRAPKLRKLTLQHGHHSATSFSYFLAATTPPLEAFRCRGTLFHGRNFGSIVASMARSLPHPEKLVEFETDAYIAQPDPFRQLADAFPNIQLLRAVRTYSRATRDAALAKLRHMNWRKCKLAKANRKLRGNFVIKGSDVNWFITSDHHDDNYRGEGLWWDRLDNTCECMETWRVGLGVTRDMVQSFMAECGIDVDDALDEDECGADDDSDIDGMDLELPTVVIQLAADHSPDGPLVLRATNLAGDVIASARMTEDTPLVQWLEHVASQLKCGLLCLKPTLADGTTLDPAKDGCKSLATLFVP
jgi:hypothetical protein